MEILSKYTTVLRHKTDEYKLGMKPINRKCLQGANIKTWGLNMEQQSNEIFRDQIDAQIKRIKILQEDGQFHMK